MKVKNIRLEIKREDEFVSESKDVMRKLSRSCLEALA